MALSEQALEMMNNAQMEAQQATSLARLDVINRAVEYYEGQTEGETLDYFDPEMMKKISYANNNITKRIIKRISQVHKVRPIVLFPEDTKQDVITAYNAATKMDVVKFARAERMLNLLNGIFLKSTFRDDQLQLEIIRDFVPIFGADPMNPIGVTYPIQASSEVTNTDAETWVMWTPTEQFKYIKGGEILEDEKLEGVNPYGLIPGVFCFSEGAPPESSYMDYEPVKDIIESNLGINLALTEMNANIRFQNFDYPFLEGVKNAGEVIINQDRFTELPPGVKMGTVGFSSHVPDTITGVQFIYQSIAQNYGLDSKFVQGVATESGIALKVRNQELMDNRSGDVENWRMIHAAMFKVRQAQMQYHFKKTLPDGMEVDFQESMQILTEQEKRDQTDWKIQSGQTTSAQVLLDSNPDAFPGDDEVDPPVTPIEQAEQKIKDNLAKTQELQGAGVPPTALDLALNQTPEGDLS